MFGEGKKAHKRKRSRGLTQDVCDGQVKGEAG